MHLAINIALELPSHDADVKAIGGANLKQSETFFRHEIEQRQGIGENTEDINATEAAKALLDLVADRIMCLPADKTDFRIPSA